MLDTVEEGFCLIFYRLKAESVQVASNEAACLAGPMVRGGGDKGEAELGNVSASITQSQAEQYELFRRLGVINVPRNTFVKMAVDRFIAELAQHALQLEEVAGLLDAKEEADARPWRRQE